MKFKIFNQTIYVTKKQIVYSVIIILGIVYLVYSIYSTDSLFEKVDEIENTTEVSSETLDITDTIKDSADDNNDLIEVYVCGQVKNTGLYTVEKGSTIAHIVKIAGGMKQKAVKDINLAYNINKNCMIRIPKTGDSYSQSDVIIENVVSTKKKNSKKNTSNNESAKININTASLKTLQDIPWVGEATAEKIIDYRKSNKFEAIEDIKNVPGIGEGKYNKMKDKICVQ